VRPGKAICKRIKIYAGITSMIVPSLVGASLLSLPCKNRRKGMTGKREECRMVRSPYGWFWAFGVKTGPKKWLPWSPVSRMATAKFPLKQPGLFFCHTFKTYESK